MIQENPQNDGRKRRKKYANTFNQALAYNFLQLNSFSLKLESVFPPPEPLSLSTLRYRILNNFTATRHP